MLQDHGKSVWVCVCGGGGGGGELPIPVPHTSALDIKIQDEQI